MRYFRLRVSSFHISSFIPAGVVFAGWPCAITKVIPAGPTSISLLPRIIFSAHLYSRSHAKNIIHFPFPYSLCCFWLPGTANAHAGARDSVTTVNLSSPPPFFRYPLLVFFIPSHFYFSVWHFIIISSACDRGGRDASKSWRFRLRPRTLSSRFYPFYIPFIHVSFCHSRSPKCYLFWLSQAWFHADPTTSKFYWISQFQLHSTTDVTRLGCRFDGDFDCFILFWPIDPTDIIDPIDPEWQRCPLWPVWPFRPPWISGTLSLTLPFTSILPAFISLCYFTFRSTFLSVLYPDLFMMLFYLSSCWESRNFQVYSILASQNPWRLVQSWEAH